MAAGEAEGDGAGAGVGDCAGFAHDGRCVDDVTSGYNKSSRRNPLLDFLGFPSDRF